MSVEKMQAIIEAALMVAGYPLSVSALQNLFADEEKPTHAELKSILAAIKERFNGHGGIELQEVANGYRFQTKPELSPWLSRLTEERPPRYSRAFLETLAIIAYKQPITRAEIEDIRGVAVSTNIMKTLVEREWVRIIGYKEVPGKPAIYGTTKTFLDYFNLKSLTELPTLTELKNFAEQEAKLNQIQLSLQENQADKDEETFLAEENNVFQLENVDNDEKPLNQ
jgi:segregation and condensation protein B